MSLVRHCAAFTVLAIGWSIPEAARADEPRAPEAHPGWKLPPCAEPDSEGEIRTSTGCSGVFGVRGAVTDARHASGTGGTIGVSAEGEELLRRGLINIHGMHRLSLGGGSAGFDGAMLAGMAGGFRVPFGERHGPILRAGVLGYLRGNDAFYASMLEIPQLQLGYQYMRGITVLELGATSGAVLVGRERAGDAVRRILGNGLEVGAYGVMQVPWIRLGVRAMQLPTTDALASNVRSFEGTVCGIAAPLAICADARAAQMEAFSSTGAIQDVVATQIGFTLGVTRER